MAVFCFESQIDVSADELYAWHHRPGAFERLVPPWETIEVAERDPALAEGARVVLKIRWGPFKFRWEALHTDFEPGRQFRDIQVAGPFSTWTHTHSFKPHGAQSAFLEDSVEYTLPFGALGQLVAGNYFSESLERTFTQRHAQTKNDLARHSVYADRDSLRVVVTGATGMVGTQLCSFLRTGGHRVDRLVRKQPEEKSTDIYWNPETGEIDAGALEGADVVIHLAGAGIGDKRWSKARKEVVMSSRARGTALLSETLAGLREKPRVLISMSGSGHYGYVDYSSKNEQSPAGTDFLAGVTVEWEGATQAARDAGIRVVICRAPMILSRRGGGLAKMLPPFMMGGGGIIATGEQPMSWLALDDLLGFFLFAMFEDKIDGPMNVSAPGVVDNREFTKTLGKVIRRPTIIPLPAFVVRTVFGEMGESLLLGGQRMDCSKLLGAGFEFLYPDLESALRHELGYPTD